jgi:hypothetical protein
MNEYGLYSRYLTTDTSDSFEPVDRDRDRNLDHDPTFEENGSDVHFDAELSQPYREPYSADSLIADESQNTYNNPGSSHISSSYDDNDQADSSRNTFVGVSSQNSSLVPASNSYFFVDSRLEVGGPFPEGQQYRASEVADHSRSFSTCQVNALPPSAVHPPVESDPPWSPLDISYREEVDPNSRTNRLGLIISGLETNAGAPGLDWVFQPNWQTVTDSAEHAQYDFDHSLAIGPGLYLK